MKIKLFLAIDPGHICKLWEELPTYLRAVPTIPPPIAPFIVTTADLVQTSFCVNWIIWYCCFPFPIQYLLITKWKVTIRNKSGIKKE